MSHTGFTWSDEQAAPPQAVKAQGSQPFAWSDEPVAPPAPNAGLAPPAGGPHSFPVRRDEPSAGKLQGLPGVNPHTPTFLEGKSDLMLASLPLAATMGVPRIIGSAIGGYVGDKGGRFLARTAGGGDTAQEIAGDVGGLVGGGIGGHRLNTGARGFIAPIADALGPEAIYPGARLPETPPTEILQGNALVHGPRIATDPSAGLGQIPVRPGEVGSLAQSVAAPAPGRIAAPSEYPAARPLGLEPPPSGGLGRARIAGPGNRALMATPAQTESPDRIASPGRIARPHISEIPEDEWDLGRYVESGQENTPRKPLTGVLRKSVRAARAQNIAKAGD
jgi:hypothetical protein